MRCRWFAKQPPAGNRYQLDECQDRRLADHAASRSSSGTERFVVQRAADRTGFVRTIWKTCRCQRMRQPCRDGRKSFQPTFLECAIHLLLRRHHRRRLRFRHPSQSSARDFFAVSGSESAALAGCSESRVEQSLLTPFGLRTLAPTDPGYEGRYQGDVVARDRAYHQGSVYPWLLGPYVTALVRANSHSQSAKSQARQSLSSCIRYMQTDGLGQIPELFDGDAPHHPGGALASARSVAEILRCYVEDVIDPAPPRLPNSEKTPQLTP